MTDACLAEQSPYALGVTTQLHETEGIELSSTGTIPEWLTGTLLRTGPSRFEVGTSAYNHWFDGLAKLHAFDFQAGRVRYRSRFLGSLSAREALAAGKVSRREFATDPCQSMFQRVASFFMPRLTDNGNVNVDRLAGEVVALTETRLPVRVDPNSLASLGHFRLRRRLAGPLSTAHPHHDAADDCTYTYLIDFGFRSRYRLLRIDRSGHARQWAQLSVDAPAYMHSFGMSRRDVILVEYPLVVSPLRLRFSGDPFIRNYRWQPQRGTRFHVFDKQTGDLRLEARAEACFAFHHVNAFDRGDAFVVDAICYPDAEVINQFYLERMRGLDPVTASGKLTRFVLRDSGQVEQQVLSEVPVELPRIDYRRQAGVVHDAVYACADGGSGDFLDSLVRIAPDSGEVKWWREPGCYPGEPVFVADPSAFDADRGVLLSVVLNTRSESSFLLVLDTDDLREIGRADVPAVIPFGFHGNHFSG